jgi:hypothetical protein
MLPLDIWRHIISKKDGMVNYKISLLSRIHYRLAKTYRFQVRQINVPLDKSYSIVPDTMMQTWNYHVSDRGLCRPFNRDAYDLKFISTLDNGSESYSLDRQYNRTLGLNPCDHVITIKRGDKPVLTWNLGFNCRFACYEYFDRQHLINDDGDITIVDRYHFIIRPDVYHLYWTAEFLHNNSMNVDLSWEGLPESRKAAYIKKAQEANEFQYRNDTKALFYATNGQYSSFAETRWYPKQRELHITFNLSRS